MRRREAVTAAALGAAALLACSAIAAAQPTPPTTPPAPPTTPPPDAPPATPPDAPPATPPDAPPATPPTDATPSPAGAPEPAARPEPGELDEIGDQGIGGEIGLAAGGRVTAGGLRVTGHYLYQLAERDWFDGMASFTFGSGAAACFRDRDDAVICQHGLASGGSIEIAAGVRRFFPARGQFRPFARAAVGLSLVRYSADHLTGLAVPLHIGAGLRARVSPSIAVVALADATLGLGVFNRGLGGQPQLGLAVTAGVEFRLR